MADGIRATIANMSVASEISSAESAMVVKQKLKMPWLVSGCGLLVRVSTKPISQVDDAG